MEVVEPVASKVGEWLVPLVVRHCGYLIRSDRYVRELNEEVEKLENAKQRVQHSIAEAERNYKGIEADVKKWMEDAKDATKKPMEDAENATKKSMEDAENATKKARPAQAHDGEAKKTCFCGWLPNLKERYRLGREAKEKVKDIRELIARGQFQKVDFENDPPGLVGGATDLKSLAGDGGDTITDSRASLFQDIMKALDDEKLKVIGVYGPGGMGKSTLLEEVEKKLRKEEKPFKMIAKSTVSRNPDMKKIQYDIAYAFRLNLNDVPSEVGRRDLLKKTIKEYPERVLIILDDLWEPLDLKEVGIPLANESNKCQLLLTSRDRSVLQEKMGAHQTFHLEGLSSEEAFRLFEETYGDELKADEGLKAKADQVVAKLAGSPLLIKSVASTLKCGDESTWDTALIKIEDPNIKSIVEWSYGRLNSDEIKSLFLLCGFVGGSIPVELLLGLGMGLGLFEGFDMTIKSSRDKLNEMLRRLRSICLLLDGSSDEENVTIHDLYSEEVISTPLTGQNTLMTHRNAGSWHLEKCWVCLVNVGSNRLAELRLHRFPDSKIFMLSEQHDERDCHGLNFASMKELRVLYLGSIKFPSFRSSDEILQNLQSLYLDYCEVEDVAILGELKALQILSFAGSSISILPKEIGKLTKLKLLNLSNCGRLKKIKAGVFEGLINLEELYMRDSFDDWGSTIHDWGSIIFGTDLELFVSDRPADRPVGDDEIRSEFFNADLAELKSLTRLTTLQISIANATLLLEDGDLPFGNLIKFWINIGKADEANFKGLTSMMLNLGECDSILSKEWVQKTLQKTQYLRLDGLREFKKKSAHELCSQGFSQLKHLNIQNCSSIKHIVSSSNGAFPLLESLLLENLSNLEKICDGPECFSRLKVIKVTKCNRLEYLWCFAEMHKLAQLEKIVVCMCDLIRAIVIDNERKDISVPHNRVELPDLRHLELDGLPKITSFCIEEDGITSDGAPIQVWFPRLESLVMANLESLDIWGSPSAKVVFDLEELEGTGHVKILSRLTTLQLHDLPKLQRMYKENAQLKVISVFRNLQGLYVRNTGLAFLFPISVAKCLREIRSIRVSHCEKMEALVVDEDGRDEGTNDIIEFPLLKRLYISTCPMIKSFSYFRGKKESVPITSDTQDAYSDSFFDPKVNLPSLEELEFWSSGSFKSIWPRELPESSFDNLAQLQVFECSALLNVFSSTITGRLHNLTNVVIEGCSSLETVFEYGPLDSNTMEQTREVPVSEPTRSSHVVKSDSQTVFTLPNLEKVSVQRCSKLRYLFPYAVATTLKKLESLSIGNCEQMKEVVGKEGGGQSNADMLTFPFLTSLSISQCPNFRAFIPNPTSVERPSGKMAIENCELQQPLFSEMVTFPSLSEVGIGGVRVKELWSNHTCDDSFCKLRKLELMYCDNLQHIAPSHIWKRLRRSLEILEVTSCRLIEIIDEGDSTVTGTVVETGQLRSLVLDDLENLRHIWRYDSLPNINVPFPNLRDIEVRRCPRLTTLFETFTASFLGQIKWLEVESCEDMELIADHGECEGATCTTITFSELDALKLEEMPKFRGYLPEKYHVEFPSHMRAFIIVGCGKEPDQSDVSDLDGWERDQRWQRYLAYRG